MKWCYLPYDYSALQDEESVDSLNLKAIQAIADFQTKRFIIPIDYTIKFIGIWWALNHERALELCGIAYFGKKTDQIKQEIIETKQISKISTLIAPNLEDATDENLNSIKNVWIENRYNCHTKDRFVNFITLTSKLPFFGISLFYGEIYKFKE